MERRNLGRFAALLLLTALVGYIVGGGIMGAYRSSDWPNQMILGHLLTQDPAHVYDRAHQAQVQRLIMGVGGFIGQPAGVLRLSSPPWLGLLTSLFGTAGLTWGGILWCLLQVGCLVLGLGLLSATKTDALYAAVGIPAWVLVANANAVGLVVLGLGLCWRLREKHPWLAGLALGLALVRPNVLIPLPFAFLMNREWKLLAGSALAAAALVLSVELIHFGLTFTWVTTVVGQAGQIGPDLTPAGIGWVLGQHLGWAFAAVALGAGLYLSRGRGPGLFVAGLLASPHALTQSLVLVSAGLASARRCHLRELLLLNAGAVVLIALSPNHLLEAGVGSALLLGFAFALRTAPRDTADVAAAPAGEPLDLAGAGAAA